MKMGIDKYKYMVYNEAKLYGGRIMKKVYKNIIMFLLIVFIFSSTSNINIVSVNGEECETTVISQPQEFVNCNALQPENEITLTNTLLHHSIGEIFCVNFYVRTNKQILGYSYESEGFDFWYIGEHNGLFTINLKTKNEFDKYNFIFNVELSDNISVSKKLYGIKTDHGLFLDTFSYNMAMENYYEYKLNNNLMSYNEYEQLYSAKMLVQTDNLIQNSSLSQNTTISRSINSTNTCSGYVYWKDDNNIQHPLKYSKVLINIGGNTSKIVYTNSNGYYYTTFSIDSATTISARIMPAGENSKVVMWNSYDVYNYTVSRTVNPGVNISFSNVIIDMTSEIGQAFQISQAIIMCANYMEELTCTAMPDVEVRYPHRTTDSDGNIIENCYYNSLNNTIFIRGTQSDSSLPNSYAAWDVIMHEYGHHVQNTYNLSANPGGTHYANLNMIDVYYLDNDEEFNDTRGNKIESKNKGIKIAWAEGWATFFGIVVQQYYINALQNIDTVGDSIYTSYDGVVFDLETSSGFYGEGSESNVAAVLYDLYDNYPLNNNDNMIGDCLNESYDQIGLDHAPIWVIINSNKPKTFSEFANFCYESNIIDNEKFSQLCYNEGMSPYLNRLSNGITSNIPTLRWQSGGGSIYCQNNRFRLIIKNENGNIFIKENLISTSYTFTSSEWNAVRNSNGNYIYMQIEAEQTDGIITGKYYSPIQTYIK